MQAKSGTEPYGPGRNKPVAECHHINAQGRTRYARREWIVKRTASDTVIRMNMGPNGMVDLLAGGSLRRGAYGIEFVDQLHLKAGPVHARGHIKAHHEEVFNLRNASLGAKHNFHRFAAPRVFLKRERRGRSRCAWRWNRYAGRSIVFPDAAGADETKTTTLRNPTNRKAVSWQMHLARIFPPPRELHAAATPGLTTRLSFRSDRPSQ